MMMKRIVIGCLAAVFFAGMFATQTASADPPTEGLVLWLDASDAGTVVALPDGVSEWHDKSGNEAFGDTIKAIGAAGRRPTYDAAAKALCFNGDQFLSHPHVLGANADPLTVVVVGRFRNLITGDWGYAVIAAQTTNPRESAALYVVGAQNNYRTSLRNNNQTTTISADTTTNRILTMQQKWDDELSQNRHIALVDGVEQYNTPAGTANPSITTGHIGGLVFNDTIYRSVTGYINEILIYNRALSDAELADLHAELVYKWDNTDQLKIDSLELAGNVQPWFSDSPTVPLNHIVTGDPVEFLIKEQFYGDPVPEVEPTDTWTDYDDGMNFPMSYTFTEPGFVALHVWMRDATRTAYASDSVAYSESDQLPTITLMNSVISYNSIGLEWDTDPASVGWVTVDGTSRIIGPTTYGELGHTALIDGLLDNTEYTFRIHADNAVSDPITLTTTVPDFPTEGDVAWSGAAAPGDTGWSRNANWIDGIAPEALSTAKILFGNYGIGDNTISEDRTAGSLIVANSTGMHTFNLAAGKKLTVTDNMLVGSIRQVSEARIVGGELALNNLYIDSNGSEWSRLTLDGTLLHADFGSVVLANPQGRASSWQYETVRPSSLAEIDLRNATLAGGTLKAGTLLLSNSVENGSYPNANLLISSATGLQNLEVAGTLGIAHGHRIGRARFGDPSTVTEGDDYKLPANVNITLGGASRGNFHVGCSNYNTNNTNGYFAASSGGVFSAYLDNMRVGYGGTGTAEFASMTSCSINANTISVGDSRPSANPGYPRAMLTLPSGDVTTSTLSIASGVKDGTSSGAYAIVELNDTAVLVNTSLAVGKAAAPDMPATLTANIADTPSGLELGSGTSLSIAGGGKIQLNFLDDPSHEEVHWGLKWEGDHVTELTAYIADEKILIDDTEIAGQPDVFFHEGSTYIGLKGARDMEFASLEVTGTEYPWFTGNGDVNVAIEVYPSWNAQGEDVPLDKVAIMEALPGDPEPVLDGTETEIDWTETGFAGTVSYTITKQGNVTLHVWVIDDLGKSAKATDSIISSAAQPDIANLDVVEAPDSFTVSWDTESGGVPVDALCWIEYRKSGSSDDWVIVGPGDYGTTHSFTASGLVDLTAYEVILRADSRVSAPMTVTTTSLPPTDGDVTWSGAAHPDLTWGRGGNWTTNEAPAVITDGKVSFLDDGIGTNQINEDRTVGSLDVLNSTGTHVFDLNDNTLTITGDLNVGDLTRVSAAHFRDGVLAPHNLYINSSSAGWSRVSFENAVLNADFHTVHLADVDRNSSVASKGELDLRGATLLNDEIRAVNLYVGSTINRNNTSTGVRGMMLLNGSTGLEDLIVTGTFAISYGHRIGESRFGDPDNGYKLPEDVNITLGTDESSRADFYVGYATYGVADGYLAASGGGVFTAFINELEFGKQATGHVDLSAMTSCTVDVNTLKLSADTTRGASISSLSLPSGDIAADSVTIGRRGEGILTLNDTTMAVKPEGSILMGNIDITATGVIEANVYESPSGLDIDGTATVGIFDGGVLRVNFLEIPDGSSDPHYGLKWGGNQVTTLEALRDADPAKLEVDISTVQAIDPDATWEIVYDAGDEATYVVLYAETPDYSTYEFTYDVPEPVYAGVDAAVPVTFASTIEGTLSYGNVRFGFEASGPGDVTFEATDDELVEHTFTNSGNWPPAEEGFALPTVYDDTTDWTLNFSETGEYTVTFRCYVVVEDGGTYTEGATIASDSVVINVEEEPLYGDANRDDVVNLLDLVFVRNRLFQPVGEGDNAQADINGDGFVDLEDLIEVRNNLGATL